MVLLLVIAACGEAAEDAASGSTPESVGTEATGTVTDVRIDPTATREPASSEFFASLTGQRDAPAGMGEEEISGAPDLVDPGPDSALPGLPVEYPEIPPVPEIASCEQAADAMLGLLQIWLDGLAYVPEQALWDDALKPDHFLEFEDALSEQASQIEAASTAIGCTSEDLEALALERIGTLVANNPNASLVLDLIRSSTEEEAAQASSTPRPTVEPVELDWEIETCQEAADLFIERTQILLDQIAGYSIGELSGEELPEPFTSFEADLTRLNEIADEIGCADDEINTLAAERVDELVADGPVAGLILESLKQAIADGEPLIEQTN